MIKRQQKKSYSCIYSLQCKILLRPIVWGYHHLFFLSFKISMCIMN